MAVLFPVSGVETSWWLPPLVAFGLSYFCSMSGISGAVVLLPFQMSVLGFTSPAVSATNLVFNVVAIPSGVYQYFREGRLVWPLTAVVVVGTVPGVIVGGFIRLLYLPEPGPFRLFVGAVLLYVGVRLVLGLLPRGGPPEPVPAPGSDLRVTIRAFTLRRVVYRYLGRDYASSVPGLFALAVAVGIVGGIYGIGGGAIIAPFLVALFHLPVHTVAGAALMGTCVTSVVGVAFYTLAAPHFAAAGLAAAPDWALGALFGVGGMAGMYLGARTQRYVPAAWIKFLLSGVMLAVGGRYVWAFFA